MNNLLHNIAFVCITKAQIFNAINIRLSLYPEANADIYLCDSGVNGISKLTNNIKCSSVFDNVYTYFTKKNTDQSLTAKIYKAFHHIQDYYNIISQLPCIDNGYDGFFISGPSSSTNALYYYFKKRFPRIKLCLFEEGVYEYYIMASNRMMFRRIYSLLVHGRFFLNDVEELYVYNPSLVQKKHQKIVLKTIPQVSLHDDRLRNIMNAVFDFKFDIDIEVSEDTILFVDQDFPRKDEELCQKKILLSLIEKIGRDKILVKMHPRSSPNKYSELGVYCVNSNQTLEMIEFNLKLEHFTIVSICSSALFNFKLIFNVKPSAILLYKVFEDQTVDSQLQSFIECFIKYNTDMNIMVPNTYEELYEMI